MTRLSEISYQCGKELTCFFENVNADNETQFVYAADRYVLSYKCLGFVNSSIDQLPVDLFRRYANVEILYAANLGLKSVSRSLFESAGKLVDLHLEGNNITGNKYFFCFNYQFPLFFFSLLQLKTKQFTISYMNVASSITTHFSRIGKFFILWCVKFTSRHLV